MSIVKVPVFYDSSVTNENAAVALILQKHPNATLFDTIGLTHAGSAIDTLIASITALGSDYTFNLTKTDDTATGCLSASQVTDLTGKLSGTFSSATVTYAQTSGSGDTLKNQPRIANDSLFPNASTINPLIRYLGGNSGLNKIDVSGTATSGTLTTVVDSGAAFGTALTTGTATSVSATGLIDNTAWTVNAYAGKWIVFTNGNAVGISVQIASNTATTLTFTTGLTTIPAGTPTYTIMDSQLSSTTTLLTTGTATDFTTNTMTNSLATWTVNAYTGATLVVTNGDYAGTTAYIVSNTATVLTLSTTLNALISNTATYNIVLLNQNAKYIRMTGGDPIGEVRKILGNTATTIYVTNAFLNDIDNTDTYEVFHYFNANDELKDYYAPKAVKTYLRNLALTPVVGAWSNILDNKPVKNVIANTPPVGTDAIDTLIAQGKVIYDYLNLAF